MHRTISKTVVDCLPYNLTLGFSIMLVWRTGKTKSLKMSPLTLKSVDGKKGEHLVKRRRYFVCTRPYCATSFQTGEEGDL